MENKTITLDYKEYLKLEEKVKLLEASTSELTIVQKTVIETDYPGYYYFRPSQYTTFRFGLNLTSEMQDELVQKLKAIKDENIKVLDEIIKQRPPERNSRLTADELGIKPLSPTILKRFKYLFTRKLD